MAALLIAMSVMAVLMTVAIPVWKHNAQREKEAELVFRGEQYGRALMMFARKHGPGTSPPTIDVLVQERELRKKYKDPITNDDFQVLLGQAVSTQPGVTPQRGGSTSPTPGSPATPQRGTQAIGAAGPGQSSGVGGVAGVASKSKDQSILIYKGRTHYNEWVFTAPPQAQVPGALGRGGIPGVGAPGGRGGRGGPGTTFTPFGPGIPGPGGRGRGERGRPGGPGPGGGRIMMLPNGEMIDTTTGQPVGTSPPGRGPTAPPRRPGG